MTMMSFSLASATSGSCAPPRYGYTASAPCATALLNASVAPEMLSKSNG